MNNRVFDLPEDVERAYDPRTDDKLVWINVDGGSAADIEAVEDALADSLPEGYAPIVHPPGAKSLLSQRHWALKEKFGLTERDASDTEHEENI